MSLEEWSWVATIVASLVALLGFPLLGWQLLLARTQRWDAIRLNTSQVLLTVDTVFAAHAAVASKLRPGGEWAGENAATRPTDAELPLVEPYLGAFERIFIAYQLRQVDAEALDELLGYRLANIWSNQRIVHAKLQNKFLKKSWSRLIALTYVIEAHRKQRFPLHTDPYFPTDLFDWRSRREILQNVPAVPEWRRPGT